MTDLTLGARVSFDWSERLVRHTSHLTDVSAGRGMYVIRKDWVMAGTLLPVSLRKSDRRSGVLVGVRTLAQGVVNYGYESSDFKADQRITALLVAHGMRYRPVFLLPANIHLEVADA